MIINSISEFSAVAKSGRGNRELKGSSAGKGFDRYNQFPVKDLKFDCFVHHQKNQHPKMN